MDLERWFIDLMENFKKIRQNNSDTKHYACSLYLNKHEIEAITDAYEKTKWIEIY